MAVVIKKFVIVNNYGTVRFTDSVTAMPMQASKTNNGATGPVIADFVNGRRVQRTDPSDPKYNSKRRSN
jgi:hypothetical protein